jgi:hypothetical protein
MEKGNIMKINAIGVTTFGNKQQFLKQASAAGAGLLATAAATDVFVKGISKPDSKVEDFVKAHDDIDSGCCFDYSACDD